MTDSQPNQPLQHHSVNLLNPAWYWRTILAGVALLFPFVVIAAIVHYVYFYVFEYFVKPIGQLFIDTGYGDDYVYYWAPAISVVAVIVFLFLCGLLFRTRVRRLVDWAMGRIPGVATLYYALRDTGQALQGPPGIENVDTVVLVPFPHQNARMAGYLMSTAKQQGDGSLVACVYIPLVLFPPSGYTVMIPEEDIIYTDWETKEVWKLLLSGGLTLSPTIPFHPKDTDSHPEKAAVRHTDGDTTG